MKLIINKNRGWRGLAEVRYVDNEDYSKCDLSMIFSFSQPVWEDLMKGIIVLATNDEYYVLRFTEDRPLPHGHQRSVLLRNFVGTVTETNSYRKAYWREDCASAGSSKGIFAAIDHFIRNNNRHTTSDFNCIGIRVIPNI